MEPPPPGIVPNFPPNYPIKWQEKVMPRPHPNHLLSMGLPASFDTNRRRNPGYGGYGYNHQYHNAGHNHHQNNHYAGDNAQQHEYEGDYSEQCGYDGNFGDYENAYNEEYRHGEGDPHRRRWVSDEFVAYDDDEDFEDDGENSGHNNSSAFPRYRQHGPAPVPVNKSHYYNLAPVENKQSGNETSRADAAARRKKYRRRCYGDRYCEACDVGFYNIDGFRQHLKEHAKCPFPDCAFAASVECLDGHITNMHLLHPRASIQINTQDYIKQRKERFPSVQRVKIKNAILEQQKKRGELLGMGHCPRVNKTDETQVTEKEEEIIEADNDRVVDDPTHVNSKHYESLDTRKYTQKRKSKHDGKSTGKKQKRGPKVPSIKKFIEPYFLKAVAPIPEFKGIAHFYEQSGEKSVFASTLTLQENDAEVEEEYRNVLDISDDDEDYIPTSTNTNPVDGDSVIKESPVESDLCENSNDNNTNNEDTNNSVNVCSVVNNTERNVPNCSANEGLEEQTQLVGALGLLMGDYASDSDDCHSEVMDTEVTNTSASIDDASAGAAISSASPATTAAATPSTSCSKIPGENSDAEKSYCNLGRVDIEQNLESSVSSKMNMEVGCSGKFGDLCSKNEENSHVTKMEVISDSNTDECSEATETPSTTKKTRRSKRGKKKRAKTSEISDTGAIADKTKGVVQGNNSSQLSIEGGSLAPHLKPFNVRRRESSSDEENITESSRPVSNSAKERHFASLCLTRKYNRFKRKYHTESLLAKLLSEEVRHERNVLLQCVRYIVNNRFFDRQL